MTKSKARGLKGALAQIDFADEKPTKDDQPGILAQRSSAMSGIVSGSTSTKFLEKIDPAKCKLWDGNGRDYENLSEASCRDLIDSLIAQGQQEIPAVVRRVTDDPAYDYELLVGFRRHWSITWLRAHDYPDFQFLVEVRDLTDEAAFRLADLENRSRADISDYERAKVYSAALKDHYAGSQARMAKRLEVNRSWLSRYLGLAELPDEVVQSFPTIHDVKFSVSKKLSPLMNRAVTKKAIVAEAKKIIKERRAGEAINGATVLKRLVEAGQPRPAMVVKSEALKLGPGLVMKTTHRKIVFELDKRELENKDKILETLDRALKDAGMT